MNETSATLEPSHSPAEEIFNSASHGLGLCVFLASGPWLIAQALESDEVWQPIGASVFATTAVVMYLASTVYHALSPGPSKRVFRTLEHCSIFLLIAGTYTPFALVVLRGAWGWTLLGVVWFLAAVGIALKALRPTRYRWLPAVLTLGLGWIGLAAFEPLYRHLPPAALWWLLVGGMSYTVGMGFFAARRVPYCHFVWHMFVLGGTSCHYFAVWHVI